MGLEILSPVGSIDSLFPAVRLGADAVYLGLKKFSARANAENFDKKMLTDVVEYCHVRDVKVYLVVNTLVKNKELSDVVDIIKFAAKLHVDAMIVQDIGIVSLIKSIVPDMPIHGSTQMSIHTVEGAKFLFENGISRVVLARELSRNEIKKIADSCDIELEVFVHGAHCFSISGQCYLSSMLGGRSGNRGRCAQPCRLPFFVDNKEEHLLSLKDLSLIKYIHDLEKIGVSSLKIEGRMKRPEYVAITTRACKLMRDQGFLDSKVILQLKNVFSRSGFSCGYYDFNIGKDMFGIRKKEDVEVASEKLFSEIRSLYKDESSEILVNFYFKAKKDERITLIAKDEIGNEACVNGNIPQMKKSVDLSNDKNVLYSRALKKTGGTPFLSNKIFCDVDDDLFIPVKDINSLRRQVLYDLEEKRKKRPEFEINNIDINPLKTKHIKRKMEIRASFQNTQIEDFFKVCDFVYVPVFSKLEDLERLLKRGFNVAVEIPRGMFFKECFLIETLNKIKSLGINDAVVSNLGAIRLCSDLGFNLHGGSGLNVFNAYSINVLENLGFKDVEVSFELTVDEINNLGSSLKRGVTGYGRLPLMLSRTCPLKGSNISCGVCNDRRFVVDRKNVKFPIICYGNCVEILNSIPIYMGDKKNLFKDIDFMLLRFTVENTVERGENFSRFNSGKSLETAFTRGLYFRGVD